MASADNVAIESHPDSDAWVSLLYQFDGSKSQVISKISWMKNWTHSFDRRCEEEKAESPRRLTRHRDEMAFLAGMFEEEIQTQAKLAHDVINRWAEFNMGKRQRHDDGNVIDDGEKRCV